LCGFSSCVQLFVRIPFGDHNVLKKGFFKEFATEINEEIAKKMKARNRPIEEIVEDTGLTEEEVKAL
jgi:hypothetical protein